MIPEEKGSFCYVEDNDRYTCEEVKKDLNGLKSLAGLIKNAISSDKIEDLDDIIMKMKVIDSDAQLSASNSQSAFS